MLFDLRGAGRRTTVKVVYLTLAILMGGGLVLFGIGGDVSGGLVDAITERGASSDSGESRYRERAAEAEAATRANPKDATAWADLARARYQLASIGDGVTEQGQFTDQGKAQLQAAAAAWERHLALDPKQPDDSVATLMVRAYSPEVGLNEPEKAVRAQEVITETRPGDASFGRLAILAYQAGQTRKGDLARKEALALADKADRNTLKAEIDAAKQQALQSQIQDATSPEAGAQGGGQGQQGGGGGGGNNNQGGKNKSSED